MLATCIARIEARWGDTRCDPRSPRLVLDLADRKGGATVSKTFMRRLVWRDLAYWQLHHWPAMAVRPIRAHYVDQVPCSL